MGARAQGQRSVPLQVLISQMKRLLAAGADGEADKGRTRGFRFH
jgi:hypothetical protein